MFSVDLTTATSVFASRLALKKQEWRANPGDSSDPPFPGDPVVEVEFEDGRTDTGHASDYDWSIDECEEDIVQYRVAP